MIENKIENTKELVELINQLSSEGKIGILSPVNTARLAEMGIELPITKPFDLANGIENLFSEDRKTKAVELAKKLPEPPDIPVPSITSLYQEIRSAIILGLNGAAITLSGILVEHVIKYATFKTEMGGFAKYDSEKMDEFERLTLGPAIDRAFKAGLIDKEGVEKLKEFKDSFRNPYNHYNLKKLLEIPSVP